MNISIFGLGYVGAVTAGCLSERGHRIIGVDTHLAKVECLEAGQSPIVERELAELLHAAKANGRLSATTDPAAAVNASDVSIICVGTPSLDNGQLNLDPVRNVSKQISAAMKAKATPHVVIYRSTMLPGSTRRMVAECFGDTSGIYYCPEFLREGSAVADFRDPSLSVLGTCDGQSPATSHPTALLAQGAKIMTWEGAELVKYSCNYLHALKVAFANEIGRVAKVAGVDGGQVMDAVCSDERLNISRYYMKPGNPFGGSCLPKDVSALRSHASIGGTNLPLLNNVATSNEAHLDMLIKLITSKGKRRIGLLGLAFKQGTDDLRGSPMVAVAETLLGRGYQLSIFDSSLNLSRLIGSNEAEINRRMPHLAQLLRATAEEVIESSELIIASQPCISLPALRTVVREGMQVIDVNGWRELRDLPWQYEGLCW